MVLEFIFWIHVVASFMFESRALDVVDKCQGALVLDATIDKSLVHELWLTYGLIVFSLEKNNISYGWEIYIYIGVLSVLRIVSLPYIRQISFVVRRLILGRSRI